MHRLCAFDPLRAMTLAAICASVAAESAIAGRAAEPPPFAEPRDESAEYQVETVLKDLDNPTSVAVRPGAQALAPSELYIAESGAGRIVRIAADAPNELAPVITGFPLGHFGTDPSYRAGPLGLEFLSRNRLVVGTGGLGDGQDLVRVYSLPDDNSPLSYDAADHSAGPVPPGGRSNLGESQFFSLAKTDRAFFVAPHRGDERGWVLKAALAANHVSDLEPFVATRDAVGAARLAALAIDPRKNHNYLAVGTMGELTPERDSRVTMLSPVSGEVALSVAAGLCDIGALAYSPRGDLYAADFAWADAAAGGIYRLEAAQVDGRESCRPVKIAAVTRPASLAFADDGALWVTALGDRIDENAKPTGVLLKITPTGGEPKL